MHRESNAYLSTNSNSSSWHFPYARVWGRTCKLLRMKKTPERWHSWVLPFFSRTTRISLFSFTTNLSRVIMSWNHININTERRQKWGVTHRHPHRKRRIQELYKVCLEATWRAWRSSFVRGGNESQTKAGVRENIDVIRIRKKKAKTEWKIVNMFTIYLK